MDLSHLLNTAIGLLVSGGLWMLRNIQSRLTKQDAALADQSKALTIISTVLMGPTGANGLRSQMAISVEAIGELKERMDKAGIA